MTIVAILLALGAAVAWSLETVLAKPGLRRMDMFSYAAIRPLFALLFVGPFGLLTSGSQFPGWRLVVIAAVAGVIDSFVGSMLFYFSVKRVSAHEASSLANTAPLLGCCCLRVHPWGATAAGPLCRGIVRRLGRFLPRKPAGQ